MSRFSMMLVVLLILVFAIAVSGQGLGMFLHAFSATRPTNQTASRMTGDDESSQTFTIILITLMIAGILFFAFGPRL
jgi:hypothetical protein